MKAECYLRIGKKQGRHRRYDASRFVFEVGVKEPCAPLYDGGGPIPTTVIKLNLELPDALFGPSAHLDITVPPEALRCLVAGEAVRP